ncbi:MAG: hypothetical protein KME64_17010 [Scytonematopsis contorta HA4267-MV1]|nr:hypothetical protein [Scytonematopsis contorta HA4267-MV1]
MSTVVHPLCWRIITREVSNNKLGWASKSAVVTELFRIKGGKLGHYLVNLAERKYYYCGETWEDVKAKFLDLGIGR